MLDQLPPAPPVTDAVDAVDAADTHAAWEQWQHGLKMPITLPALLPPLRLLLVWDNLAGHLTPALVLWLFAHGVMPLYMPLGGSWLNMAESIQRIITRRALAGQYLQTPQQIINTLEATVKGWNRDPTPFHWGGKRHARRCAAGKGNTPWPARAPAHAVRCDIGHRRCRNHYRVAN